jgi:deferrochelatase/peroxidase EfeB
MPCAKPAKFYDKLATFQAQFPDAQLGAVVAFGNNVWRQLSGGVGAEELFPGMARVWRHPPSTMC